ncbi:hypothetical protein DBP19_35970 [Streptomyces sp. CS090A]|uniref:hypothetical protein n=1 Tax=Streptomyces sp. CS090A TaxID=2162710 RepID=UPI000D5170AC|nr:hypothetical protein [Streptomyces sp. CS090A]PVC80537.1 hypothetical protein DBP19_35970 [Streptomyces sp. CS090A]
MITTSSALGYKFSRDYVTNGWYDHINGGDYTSEQQSALVDALTEAQVDEFEALLPESHYWLIHTSELQYPVGDDTETGDLEQLLSQSVEAVCARLPQIEAKTLTDLA